MMWNQSEACEFCLVLAERVPDILPTALFYSFHSNRNCTAEIMSYACETFLKTSNKIEQNIKTCFVQEWQNLCAHCLIKS